MFLCQRPCSNQKAKKGSTVELLPSTYVYVVFVNFSKEKRLDFEF